MSPPSTHDGVSERPLVSVVTPTLNRAELLEGTLESIAAQTYPAVEHIVVDGGSTDGTLDLLEQWQERTGLRWISEPDDGMYAAVNKGLSLARGEILAYLNSDDRYFPWTVATAVQGLATNPEALFVFGDALGADLLTERLRLKFFAPLSLRHLVRETFLSQPTVFWRRSAMDDAGPFDEELRYVADCDYWMRLGGRGPGIKLDEVLALELDHEETHRQRSAAALRSELDTVRRRHGSAGSGDPVGRVRAAAFRRWYLLRLALAALHVPGRHGWENFVGAMPERRLAVRWMLAGLWPFVLRHVDRRIVAGLPEGMAYAVPRRRS